MSPVVEGMEASFTSEAGRAEPPGTESPATESAWALLDALAEAEPTDADALHRLLRRYPKAPGRLFSKRELIRHARARPGLSEAARQAMMARLVRKPVRSESGIAAVTVLTKPFPCPGRCVFCPSDVRMPKSYMSMEPGAMRAARHRFDPFAQATARLQTLHANGHAIDKVELIVLGGTFTSYPRDYQLWFITRLFEALNAFDPAAPPPEPEGFDFAEVSAEVDGAGPGPRYNEVVTQILRSAGSAAERDYDLARLVAAQAANEQAGARVVGLSTETRPDQLDAAQAEWLRRLGCTKIQIGIQSMRDAILSENRRGHTVAESRWALSLLRRFGFKIHAHWMANLLGATVGADIDDYDRLFDDPAIRPDELKIYPCSLVASADLMQFYESGAWRPYDHDEMLRLLTATLRSTPRYCRLTRVFRDIPVEDIVVGNRIPNIRQDAERALAGRGDRSVDIRAREVRSTAVTAPSLQCTAYEAAGGRSCFLEFVGPDDALFGFLRLFLPDAAGGAAPIPELEDAALIREVHVYGPALSIGAHAPGRAQHQGLGTQLLWAAEWVAQAAGYRRLSVISAVGTRDYYRRRGFVDGALYQHRTLHP